MLEGEVQPDFWPVARALQKILPRSGQGGAAVCVYHRGEPVVDLWAGTRDPSGRPWRADTLSVSYSTTKGVVATLLHVLVDRGLIDYDTPVAEYWPEFAQAGKERITVRQILCHEAGLYDIRHLIDGAERMIDWNYMVAALAETRPVHPPGEAHGYHGVTFGWLVGELIQRVTGKPLPEVLERELAAPLGLDGLFCGLPADQVHRRATLLLRELQNPERTMERSFAFFRSVNRGLRALRIPIDLAQSAAGLIPPGMENFDLNSDEVQAVPIPSLNGMFTARSLAGLYAMLAGGGELGGVRILSPETVRKASEIQSRTLDRVVPFPLHWRLGYHRAPVARIRMPRAFGHAGFGGSGGWADPDRNLAVGLVLNYGVGTPFGDLRLVRIGSVAARCAERR